MVDRVRADLQPLVRERLQLRFGYVPGRADKPGTDVQRRRVHVAGQRARRAHVVDVAVVEGDRDLAAAQRVRLHVGDDRVDGDRLAAVRAQEVQLLRELGRRDGQRLCVRARQDAIGNVMVHEDRRHRRRSVGQVAWSGRVYSTDGYQRECAREQGLNTIGQNTL